MVQKTIDKGTDASSHPSSSTSFSNTDALKEHDGKVSIGGRNITNLRFVDDMDAIAEDEQELEALV